MPITKNPANLGALFAIEEKGRLGEQCPDAFSDSVHDADGGVERRQRMPAVKHPAERLRRDCVLRTSACVDGGTKRAR